jgi:hypothetical protein
VHCTRDVVKLWTGKLRDRTEVKGSAQLVDDSVQVLMTYSGSKNRPNVLLFWKDELTTNQENSVNMRK